MKALIVALALMLGMVQDPSIVASQDGEKFTVTFDAGAVWACTVYQQQVVGEPDANFPDGMYAPRHCWDLKTSNTAYYDDWMYILKYDTDWLVWSEIGYPKSNDDIGYVMTNKIRIHR